MTSSPGLFEFISADKINDSIRRKILIIIIRKIIKIVCVSLNNFRNGRTENITFMNINLIYYHYNSINFKFEYESKYIATYPNHIGCIHIFPRYSPNTTNKYYIRNNN